MNFRLGWLVLASFFNLALAPVSANAAATAQEFRLGNGMRIIV